MAYSIKLDNAANNISLPSSQPVAILTGGDEAALKSLFPGWTCATNPSPGVFKPAYNSVHPSGYFFHDQSVTLSTGTLASVVVGGRILVDPTGAGIYLPATVIADGSTTTTASGTSIPLSSTAIVGLVGYIPPANGLDTETFSAPVAAADGRLWFTTKTRGDFFSTTAATTLGSAPSGAPCAVQVSTGVWMIVVP